MRFGVRARAAKTFIHMRLGVCVRSARGGRREYFSWGAVGFTSCAFVILCVMACLGTGILLSCQSPGAPSTSVEETPIRTYL